MYEVHVDEDGGIVIDVRGDVDLAGARAILDLAESVTGAQRVAINLDGIDSLAEDAAALLVFRHVPGRAGSGDIVLLARGERGRDAVLRAYAGRRARSESSP